MWNSPAYQATKLLRPKVIPLVSAVGVQEITDPERFAHEAKERLGESWSFVYQEA